VRLETMLPGADGAPAAPAALCPSRPALSVRLNYDYFRLPLGWTLSGGMREIINRHSRGQCVDPATATVTAPEPDVDVNVQRARGILIQNGSVTSEVADQLWAGKRDGDGVIRLPCD